jgi:hypothetical protein
MFSSNDVELRRQQPTRRHPRFSLRFPVQVKFGGNHVPEEVSATTRNVSAGGVLLEASQRIPERSPVHFTMTMNGGQLARPVCLAGEGVVVRVESKAEGNGFSIAVQCLKPIAEVQQSVPDSGR